MKAKKYLIGLAVVLGLLFLIPTDVNATPPAWAPANGYRAKTRHIYFPEQNMYYDLQRGVYLYTSNGNWIASASIPTRFGRINLVSAPQVQIAVNSPYPYRYHKGYSAKNYYEYNTVYYKNQKKAYKNQAKFANGKKHKH